MNKLFKSMILEARQTEDAAREMEQQATQALNSGDIKTALKLQQLAEKRRELCHV